MANKKAEKKSKLSMNPACDFAIFLLKFVGYHVKNNIYLTWIIILPELAMLFCMLILGALEPILNFVSAIQLAKSFDVIPHYGSGVIKFLCVLFGIRKIRKLLSYEGFWEMSFCGKELENEQMKIYTRTKRAYQLIIINAMVVIAVVYVVPIIRGKEVKLPHPVYGVTENSSPLLYQLTYWFLFVGSCILLLLVEGLNCMVLSNLIFAYCQTMMLKHRLQTIFNSKIITNNDEILQFKKMKQCIQLHVKILKFLQNLNTAFTVPLLFELVGCLAIVCMQIFILTTDRETDAEVIAKCLMSIGLYTMNLYIICFASSLATSQMSTVYIAAYDSNWYLSPSRSPRMCKSLILLIQMSQQPVIFKAGGMFNLDMDTFTGVLRLAYSYYTIMKSLS